MRNMKKGILALLAVVLVFAISGWAADDDESSKALKRMDDAATDLNRLTNAPDNGIPQTVLAKAKGAFIGATLNGANVHVDQKAMRAFYGSRNPGFRDVLSGKVPAPPHRASRAASGEYHDGLLILLSVALRNTPTGGGNKIVLSCAG